ncbi:MAG: hypothetical protein U0354_13795 [Candidatus Sericytochromatia bacterium]
MGGIDFGSIINGINQATQFVGAVNGAVNVMAPALQQVDAAVQNMAGTFSSPDMMYGQPNQYYGGVPATMPMPAPQSSPPDESSAFGTIGNAVAGGAIGATLSKGLIKPKVDASEVSTEGLKNIKIPQNVKSIGMTALKAGGIGAAVGGVVSGVENFMKLSRNEITGAEATGNITADTTVGFFSGMGGLAAGAGGSLLARAAGIGAGSLPMTIIAATAGLVGSVGVDLLMRKTGVRQSIADGVRGMVG